MKLDPERAWRFTHVTGMLAITDHIGAMLLARVAVAQQPSTPTARSTQQAQVAGFINTWAGLLRHQAALMNRESLVVVLLKRHCRWRPEQTIEAADTEIAGLIAVDAAPNG